LGCAPGWGANATPSAVNHELVHVFVRNATGHKPTRPFIEEGVAWRLEGDSVSRAEPMSLDDLEKQFAIGSPLDLPNRGAAHFFAWAIDALGPETVLKAHLETPRGDDHETAALALSNALGFASLSDLHAEYARTAAFAYPALPATVKVFTAPELERGVSFEMDCDGPYTEGPSPWPSPYHQFGVTRGDINTFARLEILEAGMYDVSFEPIPILDFTPRLEAIEPRHDELRWQDTVADHCWCCQICFPTPGQYQINVERPLDEPLHITLSVLPAEVD
jgi:hypothetical protein